MWQLSAALGVGLILLGGTFKLYYDKTEAEKDLLRSELQQAISNQAILEGEIKAQNDEIERQIAREKENLHKINELTDAARVAEREVTDMRQTFARHNLNMLSVRKPGLIEKIINRGTVKVNEELATITDPSQLN